MTSIRVTNPFRSREEKLITYLEQHWNEYGNLPTGQKLIDKNVVKSLEEYEYLINLDFVVNALNVLGIKNDPDLQILTPQQLAAVQLMFDFHDGRSDIKKLRDLKINSQTWENWLRDPTFQEYLRTKVGNLFEDNVHEVDKALFLKAKSGNVEAIRLIHAIQGRYQVEVEAPPIKIGPVDAHIFIMKLFEVLQVHLVNQPDLLKQIGQSIIDIQSPYLQDHRVIKAIPNHTLEIPPVGAVKND
jgi:hypothetical protein